MSKYEHSPVCANLTQMRRGSAKQQPYKTFSMGEWKLNLRLREKLSILSTKLDQISLATWCLFQSSIGSIRIKCGTKMMKLILYSTAM